MTQQDALLSSLLKSEQRRPVDVNLGQVPITPTIGRMGNYSVVTRETPRDNSALELSRALSQLPQLLGQAKNISVAAGLKQAQEMDLEEIEKRWNKGDTEAEGFMTWLGGNKAFQEAAYQRLFDASIKPRLQKVSSEIDGMTNGELLQFDSDESIKEYAQSRLVGSIAPGVLDTVRTNSWLAIRHNRAMEAIIPDYVQKAAASIDARKRDFQEKEALAAVETNFFAHAETPIQTEYIVPEFANPDDPRVQIERDLFDQEAANKRWVNNLQASIDFAFETGNGPGRLDKFQIEDKLIPALTAKYRMLVEDGNHSEADLFLEAMESGSLNINGRPLNKSSAGMRLIQNAEAILEKALEDGEDKIDTEKMDSHQSDLLSMIAAEKVKPGYDPDTFAGSLQEMEDEVLNDPTKKWNDKEKIQLSNIYARARDGLYGRGEIHAETSDEKREETNSAILKEYKSLTAPEIAQGIEKDDLKKAFVKAKGDPLFWDNVITTEIMGRDELPTGERRYKGRVALMLDDAAYQAERNTLATINDLSRKELFLEGVTTANMGDQSTFRTAQTNKAYDFFMKEAVGRLLELQESVKGKTQPLTPEETQQREMNSAAVEQKRRAYRRMTESGATLTDEDGNIKPAIRNETASDWLPVDKDLYYPLPPANATFNNEIGRIEFKSAPVKSRLTALRGLASEASNLDRVTSVAEDIESVVGQDQEGVLYDKELELVRHSGLPLNTLLKDKGVREVSIDGGFFSEDTTAAILYNKYGHFNDPTETTKRIFNLPAVIRYIQTGEDNRLRAIHDQYLKDKMPLKDFINNQVTFFESFAGDITNAQSPQQNNK